MSGAKNVGRQLSGLGPAPTRLRQIALAVTDLERAKHLLTHVMGTEVIFEDPSVAQFGLKNFLISLGGDIIEVVSPIKENTTAGRLLSKRGRDCGYMIIMQTEDAAARRKYIESTGLGTMIWGYEHEDTVCVQYHPKGIKGGMMPELDSHAPSPNNPTPLKSRFSPWHACGTDNKVYYPGMKRAQHLILEGCVLRLAPGDLGLEAAARQWEDIFGVARSSDLLAFTNAMLGFIPGREGEEEGLVSITVGVNGRDKLNGILERASKEGVCGDGWINMCGVKWYFVLTAVSEGKGLSIPSLIRPGSAITVRLLTTSYIQPVTNIVVAFGWSAPPGRRCYIGLSANSSMYLGPEKSNRIPLENAYVEIEATVPDLVKDIAGKGEVVLGAAVFSLYGREIRRLRL